MHIEDTNREKHLSRETSPVIPLNSIMKEKSIIFIAKTTVLVTNARALSI